MSKRVVKRRPLDVLDRCLELQVELDEHERFVGDLLLKIMRPEKAGMFLKHGTKQTVEMDTIWRGVESLQIENRNLKERLAQFMQGNEPKTI